MSRRKTVRLAGQGGAQQAESQEYELRLRAAALTVALFFGASLLILVGVVGGMSVYSLVGPKPGASTAIFPDIGPERGPSAVIVDQLSLTFASPEFVEAATTTLERAGYVVDYVPGEEVTVDFYRELPRHGYDVVLLRTHAARHVVDGEQTDEARLFTSERYSPQRHVEEQREGRLSISRYDRDPGDPERYFGIPAEFIKLSMQGGFDGATVVLMGCDVLRSEELAAAFVEKGAGAVVGWDGPVTAHTDGATLSVLEYMLDDDLPIRQAVARTMAEVGPDPYTESELLLYPQEE